MAGAGLDAVTRSLRRAIDRVAVNLIHSQQCDVRNLRRKEEVDLDSIFCSREVLESWSKSEEAVSQFKIPDGTGGVNNGDRRAIYYLIRGLKPKRVLEIGTHIGASTINIATALNWNSQEDGGKGELTTIDIRNVNSPTERPWLKYGMTYSPAEMIEKLGFNDFVSFVNDTSVHYAKSCSRKYDFVFLDGDHNTATVLREIPIMLQLLMEGGVVLLHDYFPKCKPLWANTAVVDGPYLAIKRLTKLGAELYAKPLGALPWPTKLKSNVTSLAMLLRA
jgi:predicted O-methyltransferase YrrM